MATDPSLQDVVSPIGGADDETAKRAEPLAHPYGNGDGVTNPVRCLRIVELSRSEQSWSPDEMNGRKETSTGRKNQETDLDSGGQYSPFRVIRPQRHRNPSGGEVNKNCSNCDPACTEYVDSPHSGDRL